MSALTRVTYGGHILNERTLQMLLEMERVLGYTVGVTQGSYNRGGVAASAGTHDGGGALDVTPHPTPGKTVETARRVGFAAWHRLPSQGHWSEHIHMIAIGDRELSAGAQQQVAQYKAGQNGLANHGPDTGAKVSFRTFEEYKAHRDVANRPDGRRPTLRVGSKGPWVRYLQWRLNAVNPKLHIQITGVYDAATVDRIRIYKVRHKFRPYNSTTGNRVWRALGIPR